MRVRYDEEADALYIKLQEGGYHESDEIKDGFILDYDLAGNIIGIEILSTVNFEITRPLVKAAGKSHGTV